MTRKLDPRKDADDAFQVFLSMGDREWIGASVSSMGGLLFEPEERKGYERASEVRAWAALRHLASDTDWPSQTAG